MGKGKFYLLDGGNTAYFLIDGMIVALVGQLCHRIQFFGGQRQSRRVLHQVLLPMLLHHSPAGHVILLFQLEAASAGISLFILRYFIEGSTGDGIFRQGGRKGAKIAGAADILHSGRVFSPGHAGGNFGHLVLAHPINQKIRTAFHQNGGAHRVVPVIIMSKPP